MSDLLNEPVMYEMTSEQYVQQIRAAEKRGAVKALRGHASKCRDMAERHPEAALVFRNYANDPRPRSDADRVRRGDLVTTPTLEEMQTARNRLIRLHRIPTDAAVAIDADHLIVTLARVEDYDRLRAELRLHPLATYRNRQTGWYSESQITLIHEIPRGVIPPRNARAVA